MTINENSRQPTRGTRGRNAKQPVPNTVHRLRLAPVIADDTEHMSLNQRMDRAMLALSSVIDLVEAASRHEPDVARGGLKLDSFAVLLKLVQSEFEAAQTMLRSGSPPDR